MWKRIFSCFIVFISNAKIDLKNGKFNVCKAAAAAGPKEIKSKFLYRRKKRSRTFITGTSNKGKRNASQSSSPHLNTRSNKRIEISKKVKWQNKQRTFLCVRGGSHCCYYYHFHKPSIEGIKIKKTMVPQFSFKWIESKLLALSVDGGQWPLANNYIEWGEKNTLKTLSR